MSTLHELERRLGPQIRRALSEVMPHLEAPPEPRQPRAGTAGDSEPVHVGETPPHRPRSARWLITSAAGLIVVVGGLLWMKSSQRATPTAPADAPATLTAPPGANSTLAGTPPTSAPGPGPYPFDELDPLEAARWVSLSARINASPDEYADLAVAGEIMRRECMTEGGATPPPLTPADHTAVRDQAIEALRQRIRFYTTEGLEVLRAEGFYPDRHAAPSSENDPLRLPVAEGTLEAELLVDGCGRIDRSLRAGPVEQSLNRLKVAEVDGHATDSRWAEMALTPESLPEFAEGFAALRDCMAQAGYPNHFDRGAGQFGQWASVPGATEAELAVANAYADCIVATNFPTTYVETVKAVLDEFDLEYETELAALRDERDTALELARTMLTRHGIDPFT